MAINYVEARRMLEQDPGMRLIIDPWGYATIYKEIGVMHAGSFRKMRREGLFCSVPEASYGKSGLLAYKFWLRKGGDE